MTANVVCYILLYCNVLYHDWKLQLCNLKCSLFLYVCFNVFQSLFLALVQTQNKRDQDLPATPHAAAVIVSENEMMMMMRTKARKGENPV